VGPLVSFFLILFQVRAQGGRSPSGGAGRAARCAALAAGPSRQDTPPGGLVAAPSGQAAPPGGEVAPPAMASPVLGGGAVAERPEGI
jgi:hypothetical protein